MQQHFRPAASSHTRLILIDLVRSDLGEQETAAYRPLLVQARKTGVPVAHSYLSDDRSPKLGCHPIEGLSPLPDEAVFMRNRESTFSSRQFCDWVGAASGPLVFAGAANAALASAKVAAALGHQVFVSPVAANANEAGFAPSLSLYRLECAVQPSGDTVEHLMRRLLDSEIANG